MQSTGGAGGDHDQPMAYEPAAGVAAGWHQWEDISARHASISLSQTLELLRATVGEAPPGTGLPELLRDVSWRVAPGSVSRTCLFVVVTAGGGFGVWCIVKVMFAGVDWFLGSR